jgi:hypothetical protein
MLPFEEPDRPFFSGLVETLKLLITDPTTAFRQMSLTTDIWRPLVYGVLISWVASLVGYLWSLAIQASILGVLAGIEGMQEIAPMFAFGVGFGAVGLLLAPVVFVIQIFIYSLIVHLCLMLVGGDREGLGATFRVACYSKTTQLALIVPFVGGIIALVWGLILCIIGLTEAHRTTTGKAVAAVLLPVLLCCVCIASGVTMLILMGIQADSWG